MVNIKGLNKAEVLKALYDRSHEQGMGFLQAVPSGVVTVEHCEELLRDTTYFDYLYGRVLKVDLSDDSFDERLYDRDCGPGAAQRAIDSIGKVDTGGFALDLGFDFEVNIDPVWNQVRFRFNGTRSLDALIHHAQQLRKQMRPSEYVFI